MKTSRSKPRAGRLKGDDLEQLRRDCFTRDKWKCVKCGESVVWDAEHPKGGEMMHIRNKRMWGDSLDNVETGCHLCHKKYHQYGPSMKKPCPPKPRISESQSPTTASGVGDMES